jgi:hypothetical protein
MRILLALGLLVGCGGGEGGGVADVPGGGDCGTDGSGSVTGTVGGASIMPVVRANQVTIGGAGVAIVLDEIAGSCGMPGNTGEHLVLLFCSAPTAGTHTVVSEQQFMCPGTNAGSLVEQNGGMDFAEPTGGSITVDSADGSCTAGSFSINYIPAGGGGASEQLTGTFNAVVCP